MEPRVSPPNSTLRLTAMTALAPASWGTTYIVTTEWLPPDRPLLSAAVRALPAGLIALALTRTLPQGHWWWRAAVLGTLNIGAFFALLFVGAYRLPGGVAATLAAVQPLVVAGLAYAILQERPTSWRLCWAVAGVAGVAMMVLRPGAALDAVGLLAALAGTVVMGLGIVLTKRWGRPVGVLAFTGWQLTAGGLLLTVLALAIEGRPPHLGAAALAGFGWLCLVGTLLAYALWFRGLQRLPVTSLSFLSLLSPAVAALLGWLVLDQAMDAVQTTGFILALLAIAAAQLSPSALRRRGYVPVSRGAAVPTPGSIQPVALRPEGTQP